ncbi:MAG: hypothetical protein DRZ90_03550 [Spirochaetes bacterium]|nr:MAG: hypothetical protein DRZ90_03550 [Spirochaetota bacterium]
MLVIPGFRILKVESRGSGKLTEIVCESIAGGLEEGADFQFIPGFKPVKIKSVVKNGEDYRLRIKGIARSSLFAGGMIISSKWPVTETREALLLPDGKPVPLETEIVRGGLCPDFNRERFIGRGSFHLEGSFLSIQFPKPFPMFPGAVLTILGANRVPRKFTVVWPGMPSQDERRKLNNMARRRPDPHPEAVEIYGRILHVRGFVEIPQMFYKNSWEGARLMDSWLILQDRQKVLERKILKIVSRPGGADKRLLRIPDYPENLVLSLVGDMCGKGTLEVRNGWFFPVGDPPLSPYHRGWLKKIKDAGEEGVRVRSINGESDRAALEVLLRSGYVSGGESIWLSPEALELLGNRLMDGRKKGDEITMAGARECLGGSRTRTLEVLSILESKGTLTRSADGDSRIVM